ncbi:TRM5 [Candida pseudojiufengensis]|uniref:TRM5 n=1 Tax=Candida pseudojiufengensis TaxID=497109 RepID=UPI0022251F9C|nr:TRM5 [Candida pseudojiufengensis]KAI5965607.1 TRM5 [Candida pseudojiufengensis]
MNLKLLSKLSKTQKQQTIMSKYSPPINRSMINELDRNFFQKEIPLTAAWFPQPKYLTNFIKTCQSDIFYVRNIKHIIDLDNSKAVLLREGITNITDLHETTQLKIQEYNIKLIPYLLKLDYSFWKSDEILKSILPENLIDEIPQGFSQAGHLAHLNLRDEFKPYGKIIGQIIMDKNPSIKTVVDKKNTIANKFRTFPLELLAGEENFIVEQNESGCKFKFDFSKVYWNSRLSSEHERLIEKFKKGEVIGDVMAGVGPFAIPSGKNESIILANDLNPESFKYLKENIKLNKVEPFVKPYNLDGREFINNAADILNEFASNGPIEKKIIKRLKGERKIEIKQIEIPKFYHHFVMNLPDSALTFLDAFIGLYSNYPQLKNLPNFKLPWIHVHCFEKFENGEDPTIEELSEKIWFKICKLIEFELDINKMEFHKVRMVSPTKPMFCVSFQLPEEIAFRPKIS